MDIVVVAAVVMVVVVADAVILVDAVFVVVKGKNVVVDASDEGGDANQLYTNIS